MTRQSCRTIADFMSAESGKAFASESEETQRVHDHIFRTHVEIYNEASDQELAIFISDWD